MKRQDKINYEKKIKDFENSKAAGIKGWFGYGKTEE